MQKLSSNYAQGKQSNRLMSAGKSRNRNVGSRGSEVFRTDNNDNKSRQFIRKKLDKSCV